MVFIGRRLRFTREYQIITTVKIDTKLFLFQILPDNKINKQGFSFFTVENLR